MIYLARKEVAKSLGAQWNEDQNDRVVIANKYSFCKQFSLPAPSGLSREH